MLFVENLHAEVNIYVTLSLQLLNTDGRNTPFPHYKSLNLQSHACSSNSPMLYQPFINHIQSLINISYNLLVHSDVTF